MAITLVAPGQQGPAGPLVLGGYPVVITNLLVGQSLVFDGASWVNQLVQTGSGSQVTYALLSEDGFSFVSESGDAMVLEDYVEGGVVYLPGDGDVDYLIA